MAKEPVATPEPQPSSTPEPVTEPIKPIENTVPQSRLNEVIGERNSVRDELEKLKNDQQEKADAAKKEKGEFKELYTGEKEITENLNAELKQYEADDRSRWESIVETIPEDKQKFFPKGESKEQIRANLTKYQEWTEAGVFKSSTIPSTNTNPPTQSHIPTGKIGPDSQGRYFDTEADFLKTSSDDYGKWLTSQKNLDDAPIGVFKVKGQEYTV